MKEPQRDDEADMASRTSEQEVSQQQEAVTEPKAYAFDGWGMVPLEFDPV